LNFANSEALATSQSYYVELGARKAAYFSWVFVKDNILVQINGQLEETRARQYEQALATLGVSGQATH
jgi:hypothetical protein